MFSIVTVSRRSTFRSRLHSTASQRSRSMSSPTTLGASGDRPSRTGVRPSSSTRAASVSTSRCWRISSVTMLEIAILLSPVLRVRSARVLH